MWWFFIFLKYWSFLQTMTGLDIYDIVRWARLLIRKGKSLKWRNRIWFQLKLSMQRIFFLLTLMMLRSLSSIAQKAKHCKSRVNPVMLVFIGKLSLSSLRWVPICHGLSFPSFLSSFHVDQISNQQLEGQRCWIFLKSTNQEVSWYLRRSRMVRSLSCAWCSWGWPWPWTSQ